VVTYRMSTDRFPLLNTLYLQTSHRHISIFIGHFSFIFSFFCRTVSVASYCIATDTSSVWDTQYLQTPYPHFPVNFRFPPTDWLAFDRTSVEMFPLGYTTHLGTTPPRYLFFLFHSNFWYLQMYQWLAPFFLRSEWQLRDYLQIGSHC